MTGNAAAIAALVVFGLALVILLDRWARRRPEKGESEGNYDYWSDGRVRGPECDSFDAGD